MMLRPPRSTLSTYTPIFRSLRMQELTPSMALKLLKSGMRIRTIALITVVETVIWSSGPHQLRHRFGQHAPLLLAGLEPLLSPFLLLNIGVGAKPLGDLACFITYGHNEC